MSSENTIEYASVSPKSLHAKDIFGIIVRTIGLLVVLYGLYTVWYGVAAMVGLLNGIHSVAIYIIFGVFYVAFGLFLMRGNWVTNFAYGRD
jgi:hypothetical protein